MSILLRFISHFYHFSAFFCTHEIVHLHKAAALVISQTLEN